MNLKMVFHTIGRMAKVEGVLMLLPLAVSLMYREKSAAAFLVSALISFAAGILLTLLFRPKSSVIYAKEGFTIVALVWLSTSAIGALPFVISGDIPSYVDALFETVSGFTTTGASILTNVGAMNKGCLFWRSFTHWIGGMGVLVFVMAIVPNISDRSIHILKAEMPGPVVGKIVPRVKDTAKILYLIYIVMTAVEIILLLCGGMPLFDSVVHSFGTAGTGGFGIKADSIAGYNSYLQWVIAIFMVLFGVNFNLYYLALIKRFRSVLRSTELWCYLGIIAVSVGAITANIYPIYKNLGESLRLSSFQVSSIITTTGFATANFDLWPDFSKNILLLLMFVGACAGSTAGGLKIPRIIILWKMISREFRRMLHPHSVSAVIVEGKEVDSSTISGVATYFALYAICFVGILFVISIEPFDMETNLSAVSACYNNVGPGFGAVGPAASYAEYSVLSKLMLSFAMLLGRLEIYPMLLALSPMTWRKK